MIVTTMDHVAGHTVGETLGLVRGAATWSRRVSKTYAGGIRGIEVHGLAELDQGLADSRQRAMDEAELQAKAVGATAIVGLATEVKELTAGVFMVCVSGTAVKTFRLPAAAPSFRPPSDLFGDGLAFIGAALERASFEGSLVHH